MYVVDASVVLRWFVDQEPDREAALGWLQRRVADPDLLVAPDLLRFEVHSAFARLQRDQEAGWAAVGFGLFERIALRTLPTTRAIFDRGLELSREFSVGGYDSVYLAHAEALHVAWLTADRRVLRRMKDDPRVRDVAE